MIIRAIVAAFFCTVMATQYAAADTPVWAKYLVSCESQMTCRAEPRMTSKQSQMYSPVAARKKSSGKTTARATKQATPEAARKTAENKTPDCAMEHVTQFSDQVAQECERLAHSKNTNAEDKVKFALALAGHYRFATFSQNLQTLMEQNKVSQQRSLYWLDFAAKQAPRDLNVLFVRALTHQQIEERNFDSIGAYKDMIAIAEDDWRGHFGLVRTHLRRGALQDALDASERLFKAGPENPLALAMVARVMHTADKPEIAIQMLERASKLATQQNYVLPGVVQEAPPELLWAELAARLQGGKRAAEIITILMNKIPNPRWLRDRAGYYAIAEMYDEAVADLDALSREVQTANYQDLQLERALLLLKAGKSTDMIAVFRSEDTGKVSKRLLRLQLFLRRNGYKTVEITGRFDKPTEEGLIECGKAKTCKLTSNIAL